MVVTSVQDTLSRVQLKPTTDPKVPYLYKESLAINTVYTDREQRKVTVEVYLELFNAMFDAGAKQFEEILKRPLGEEVIAHHKKAFGHSAFRQLCKIMNGSDRRALPYLNNPACYIDAAFFMGIRMVPADFMLPEGVEMHWDNQPFPVFAWHFGITGVETDINDPLKIVHREIIQHMGCMHET